MKLDKTRLGYSIPRTLKLAKKLKADVGERYFGERLEGKILQRLIEDLADHKQICLSEEELKNFLWPLAGKALSFDLGVTVFERLARSQVSAAGTPTFAYTAQPRDEWVPVEILAALTTKNRGVRLITRVLTGLPALERAEARIKPQVVWKLCRAMGFARKGPKRWSGRVGEFHHLWCVFLAPESSERSIALRKIGINDACIHHNRPMLDARKSCPRGLPHGCWNCPNGTDKCEFAVRDYSWIRAKCMSGHVGWFRPTDDMGLCIHCRRKEKRTV